MKKSHLIILIGIILIISVIVIAMVLKKPEENIIKGSDIQKYDSPLIKEKKTMGDITFEECNIVAVDNKLHLKVVAKNNSNKIYSAKSFSIILLDSAGNTLESKEYKSPVIAGDNDIIIKLDFDEIYKDINDIKYVVNK